MQEVASFQNSTNMTIVNSIFHKLISVSKGGGVYCIGESLKNRNITSSPIFTNVAFLGNRAGIRGGAISADVGCDFICNSCKLVINGIIHLEKLKIHHIHLMEIMEIIYIYD